MLIKRTGNNIPVNVVSSFATSLRRGIIRERIQSCWGKKIMSKRRIVGIKIIRHEPEATWLRERIDVALSC